MQRKKALRGAAKKKQSRAIGTVKDKNGKKTALQTSQGRAFLKKCKTNFHRLWIKMDIVTPPEISLANWLKGWFTKLNELRAFLSK